MAQVPTYVIPSLDSGSHWETNLLTYSIPVAGSTWSYEGDPKDNNYSTFNSLQTEQFRKAINAWDEVIDLDFIEVIEPEHIGDIRIAFSGESYTTEEAAGWASYPGDYDQAGDIWIQYTSTPSTFIEGSYEFHVLLHEIGHAMGLSHPVDLPSTEDKHIYTNMSAYTANQYYYLDFFIDGNGNLSSEVKTVNPQTPTLYDIATIQSLYGIETSTRTDNTTYSWDKNEKFYMSIWDSAGNDTIDASNQTFPSIINLNEGAFSSIAYTNLDELLNEMVREYPSYESYIKGDLKEWYQDNKDIMYFGENNLSIAYGAVIENAIGGKNNDILLGNQENNKLTGNEGNDSLDGKGGFDTAIYNGNYNQYAISFSDDGNQTIISDLVANDGIDTLENIEQLQFKDTVVRIESIRNTPYVPTSSNEVITAPIEGDENQINYFLLEISSPLSTSVSVHYETKNGSAIAGQDYIAKSGTATIPAGQMSIAIGVEIIGDNIIEDNETFSLVVTNPEGGLFPNSITELIATHIIIDDDTTSQNQKMKIMGINDYGVNIDEYMI